MKKLVWITAAIMVITFQSAYSNTCVINGEAKLGLCNGIAERLIVTPPVKSRAWYKKTVWKNGRSSKAWAMRRFKSYRPGRYLTATRYKAIDR